MQHSKKVFQTYTVTELLLDGTLSTHIETPFFSKALACFLEFTDERGAVSESAEIDRDVSLGEGCGDLIPIGIHLESTYEGGLCSIKLQSHEDQIRYHVIEKNEEGEWVDISPFLSLSDANLIFLSICKERGAVFTYNNKTIASYGDGCYIKLEADYQ